jgi:WD40-like Beta Propeller Repeat
MRRLMNPEVQRVAQLLLSWTEGDPVALPISGADEAQGRQAADVNTASPTQGASATARSLKEGRGNQWMTGDPKPIAVSNTPFEERSGQFSPDGRWVAYQSNETGRFEIYVQPFPGPGVRSQVSTAGGKDPRWQPDGKELFFIAPDGKLMAATIRTQTAAFEAGSPAVLFQTRVATSGVASLSRIHRWKRSRNWSATKGRPAVTACNCSTKPACGTWISGWQTTRRAISLSYDRSTLPERKLYFGISGGMDSPSWNHYRFRIFNPLSGSRGGKASSWVSRRIAQYSGHRQVKLEHIVRPVASRIARSRI